MKATIAIIVAVILIGGGLFLYNQQQAAQENDPASGAVTGKATVPQAPDAASSEDSSTEGADTPSETSKTVTVTYTAQGFSPAAVIVSKGDTVRFVNESGSSMWVASARHPTHTVYDGTSLSEHCGNAANNDAFDQCSAGDEYSFTFGKTGDWKYHDHLHPSKFGSVTVE